MPRVVIVKRSERHEGEVKENSNLVVRAGIKQFPFPHLAYGCGMAKCAKCVSRILKGAQSLPPPNWKEEKLLGSRLGDGFRLMCQLWIHHDIELTQDEGDMIRAEIAARRATEAAQARPADAAP